jgi:hypothetical protein
MLKIPKIGQYSGIRVVEESVLIAEAFHIVCIFQKEDLILIDVKATTGEKLIELKTYS